MDKLRIEGARIIWKNFRGKRDKYNTDGSRTFNVVIEDLERAQEIINLGWALKPLKNEDGETEAYFLPVKVNYDSQIPPRIHKVSISGNSSLPLDERSIDMLDYLPIEYVDIIVSPYVWSVGGNTGVKAYCQTMYVVIEENELDLKWANYQAEALLGEE